MRIKCFVNEAEKEEGHSQRGEYKRQTGVFRPKDGVIEKPELHHDVPLKPCPIPTERCDPTDPNTAQQQYKPK